MMEPVVLRAGFGGLSLLWFLSLQVQGNWYWNQEGVRVGGSVGIRLSWVEIAVLVTWHSGLE